MAYYNEDQLKRYFENAIKRESEIRIEKLRKEIDYLYSKEMSKVNAEQDLKNKLETSKALRELQIEHQDKINQIGIGYDEQLIKERQVMVNNVFEAVYKKLVLYRQSKDYQKSMSNKYEDILKYAKGLPITIEIGKEDGLLEEVLKKRNQEFSYNEFIHFGGFVATIDDLNVSIDHTIDQKLEERKKWFYENARLFIKK
jgi:vacuolar-type H+-ATPase subunit E/Vma4